MYYHYFLLPLLSIAQITTDKPKTVPGTNIPCTPELCPQTPNNPSNNDKNNNTNTEKPAQCDPYTALCPDSSCENAAERGTLSIISPNDKVLNNFINSPINITWTYEKNVKPEYPKKGATLYYRKMTAGSQPGDYVKIGDVSGRTNQLFISISNVQEGGYELLIMPDNVNIVNAFKVGNQSSCVAEGWPTPAKSTFRLMSPHKVLPYQDIKYGPNKSFAHSSPIALFLTCFLLVASQYFLL
ncbi:hypothetical protein BC833DRAFT_598357 [Globomyces pollinis-pini]|nr:hypothetical protein BC833DRAFT_598357 [Globomyces pollinis-pini]KAJ2987317.1 hypothetical protein HDV02_006249 [Globomyces sp. JEL0801]